MATTKFGYTETNLNDLFFYGYKEKIKISTGIIQPPDSPLGKKAIKVNVASNIRFPREEGLKVSTININVGQEIILLPFLSTNYMPTNKNFIEAFNSNPADAYPTLNAKNVTINTYKTGGGLIDALDLNECTYNDNMSVVSIGTFGATIFDLIKDNKIPLSKEFMNNGLMHNLGLPFVLSSNSGSTTISTATKPIYYTISTLIAYTLDLNIGLHLSTFGIGPRFKGNPKTFKTNHTLGKFGEGGISFGEPINVLGISKVYSLNGNMPLLGVISNNPDIERYTSLQFNKSVICGGYSSSEYTISLSTAGLSIAGPNGTDIDNPNYGGWVYNKGDIIGVCHIDPSGNPDWGKIGFLLGTLIMGTSARLAKITFMNELQSSISDTPSKYPEYCNNMPCKGEPLVFDAQESKEYGIYITSKHVPWIADPFINKATTPALYSILMKMEFVDLLETKKVNFKADSTSVKTIKLNGASKTLPFTETIKY